MFSKKKKNALMMLPEGQEYNASDFTLLSSVNQFSTSERA
jgi:hypothetical protein